MKLKTSTLVLGAILIGGTGLSGCATRDFVRKTVAPVDQKADAAGQQANVANNTANDALNRANAAHKLAEGKFLYEMVLSDDSVKFPTNGSDLSEEAKTRISDFVTKLKTDNKNVYVEIQGHTDTVGSPAYNMKLGEQRADAVRLFMNQQGVPLNRMSTISYGQTAPVASNDTPEGRAQNRRVVVIVMS
jgi:outer membrane protein OmpA-like peptidoglycan-associated protein